MPTPIERVEYLGFAEFDQHDPVQRVNAISGRFYSELRRLDRELQVLEDERAIEQKLVDIRELYRAAIENVRDAVKERHFLLSTGKALRYADYSEIALHEVQAKAWDANFIDTQENPSISVSFTVNEPRLGVGVRWDDIAKIEYIGTENEE